MTVVGIHIEPINIKIEFLFSILVVLEYKPDETKISILYTTLYRSVLGV